MYEVAIVSHERADVVGALSLRVLADGGVSADRVKLFVTPGQEAVYRDKVDSGLYGEIVTGSQGLTAQRRRVQQTYAPDTLLVQMDDDVSDVKQKVDDQTAETVQDLDEFLVQAFEAMAEAGANLWGLYPTLNPMFMKHRVVVGLHFCVGHLFGVRNSHDEQRATVLANKDDYERTLRYWQLDGRVVRFDGVACDSPLYRSGGLQAADQPERHARNRREVRYLLEHWPQNVRIANRRNKKVGLEIRLVEK